MLGDVLRSDRSTLGSGCNYEEECVSFFLAERESLQRSALHQKFLIFLFFILLGPRMLLLLLLAFVLLPLLLLVFTVAFTTWCIFVDADSVPVDLNELVKVFPDFPT